jgi:glycosyltransferase involved in cell wall biosynthesis
MSTATTSTKAAPTITCVVPTYKRERVLVETLSHLVALLRSGDEIVVVDQTPRHEPDTEAGLCRLTAHGEVRWFRRDKPSQCEAMNAAAAVSRGDILLFLDDDVIPSPNLLEAHRAALTGTDVPPATCGQVLQPWDERPVERVVNYEIGFNAAYDKPCDILSLMAGNFAMRREVYFQVGGMDENFIGSNYRNDAEMAYRIYRRTGRKVRFVPEATMRHLYEGGGNRAFGAKDTWGHIGGSIGDYYFAVRCLPTLAGLGHSLRRFFRAPLNRNTARHPWLIPSLYLREAVAWARAWGRAAIRTNNYVKDAAYYGMAEVVPAPAAGEPVGFASSVVTQ